MKLGRNNMQPSGIKALNSSNAQVPFSSVQLRDLHWPLAMHCDETRNQRSLAAVLELFKVLVWG